MVLRVPILQPRRSPVLDDGARDKELADADEERRNNIAATRRYYAGTQYDSQNAQFLAQLNSDNGCVTNLEEHEREHAYTTHIGECIDFIASQLSTKLIISSDNKVALEKVNASLQRSKEICPSGNIKNLRIARQLRDALIAGDVVAHVRFDVIQEVSYVEFVESERVRFDYDQNNTDRLERVIVDRETWVQQAGHERKVQERTEYVMHAGSCWKTVYLDNDKQPDSETNLHIPFIPWLPLRAYLDGLSSKRGSSLIKQKIIRASDRFNAVEQTGWLIARQNSHSSVVITGDGAYLLKDQEGRETVLHKDIADVLLFPSGTNVTALSLPTDPEMIEHQREVLLDSIFGSFGLARVDQTTIGGYANLSGYALEILNRKTDGTFSEIQSQFIGDFKALLNMLLDMQAWQEQNDVEAIIGDDPVDAVEDIAVEQEELVDLSDAYGARDFDIEMGSAYIADDVMIRDDYTAGLLSRQQALRLRGWEPDDIADNEKQIAEERDSIDDSPAILNGVSVAREGATSIFNEPNDEGD